MLNASCDLQAAKDRSDQLQEQLARRGTDVRDAKEQLANVQQELAGKCKEVTKGEQERAALQSSLHATLKARIHCAWTLLDPHMLSSPPPLFPPCSFPTLIFGCYGIESTCALVAHCGISRKPYSVHCNPNATA